MEVASWLSAGVGSVFDLRVKMVVSFVVGRSNRVRTTERRPAVVADPRRRRSGCGRMLSCQRTQRRQRGLGHRPQRPAKRHLIMTLGVRLRFGRCIHAPTGRRIPNQIKSNYFIVRLKVDQRAGRLSLPHVGITKTEK